MTLECWHYLGNKTEKGYGRYGQEKAARLMYESVKGKIPAGLQVLHHCDNPPCVNPKHLWLGTNADNVADKVKKGRAHRSINNKFNAKLKPSTVLKIRKVAKEKGLNQNGISRLFSIPRKTAWNIIERRTWKDI